MRNHSPKFPKTAIIDGKRIPVRMGENAGIEGGPCNSVYFAILNHNGTRTRITYCPMDEHWSKSNNQRMHF